MASCPNCGTNVGLQAEACTRCGALFGPDSAWRPLDARASLADEGGAKLKVGAAIFSLRQFLLLVGALVLIPAVAFAIYLLVLFVVWPPH